MSNEVVVVVVEVVGGKLGAQLNNASLHLTQQKQFTVKSFQTVAEKQESNAL